MKVLLSAYACEPGKGSEPGVGWNWARAIASLGHETFVLTRANNRGVIEAAADRGELPPGVHFHYMDLPGWLSWWKRGNRGVRLYYYLWQFWALRHARRLHEKFEFDLVHHITFGVLRHPSFMGGLKIPFIIGPLGGGEQGPRNLVRGLPFRARLGEFVRALSNRLVFLDPNLWGCYARAEHIYLKTSESKDALPERFHEKSLVQLEIGSDGLISGDAQRSTPAAGQTRHILFVGRLIPWKGVHLAIAAIAAWRKSGTDAKLTIIGSGPDEKRLRSLAAQLDIGPYVEWTGQLPQDQLFEAYRRHHVLLFPSLHDSSGNVVLESLSAGLPVVCLNIGGPGQMVDSSCGVAVDCVRPDGREKTQDRIVAELASALEILTSDPSDYAKVSTGAANAASRMTWQAQVASVYGNLASDASVRTESDG